MFCYALNAQTGKFRLKVQAYEVISSPAVADSKVYFTSRSYLYVMNGKARNWPYELELRPWWIQFYALNLAPPPPPRSGVMWGLRLAYGTSNTTPILSGNKLFTTGDNKVYRLDLGTHKFDWTFTANRTINSSPALANGVIYVGSDDGTLYAIDAESGKKLWSYRTGDTILSSPTVVDGVVYVTSLDGKLYAIQ
jgi:outer membrane protein assembly factor BamB